MDNLIFTVDELVTHLMSLKGRGIITGKEPVLDTGYFGITHVVRHIDGEVPVVTLESDELNVAAIKSAPQKMTSL